MHIKHIHETIEKLSKYACEEACKNKEAIDTKELGEVVDMVKDLSEAEYYSRISKAMEEAEKEDEEEAKHIMKKMKEEYGEEEGERRFYDDYRYKRSGRFAPKGRGSYMPRRGYDEPPYYHMMPNEAEYYRDMDRMNGKMYYSGGGQSSSGNSSGQSGNMSGNSTRGYSDGYSDGLRDGSRNNQRDGREGRSGQSRRSYMETKEMHKSNSSEDKQHKMKELEKYMGELSGDITEMISDATPEEKALLKQKMQMLMQKI
jgi:hypothetical protein